MAELKVTSIEELRKVAEGDVIELPPFGPGQPFVARLRRPSMLALVKKGKIPNQLLLEANKLFIGGAPGLATFKAKDKEMMSDMLGLMEIICQESFVEPKYSDLKETGVELTDDQYMFVFSYIQRGVESLKSFREQRGDSEADRNNQNT